MVKRSVNDLMILIPIKNKCSKSLDFDLDRRIIVHIVKQRNEIGYNMKSLNDIRKAIKPLGFTIVSVGRVCDKKAYAYKHLETGETLRHNVFDPEGWLQWEPIVTWSRNHSDDLNLIRKALGIVGLTR